MISQSLRKRCLLTTTALAAGFVLPIAAHAQQSPRQNIRDNIVETDKVLDAITVTTNRREENLQDVPISVTAFDAEAIENLRLQGFQDLQNFTPGLVASPNPSESSGIRLTIRGIGQDDPQIGFDPTVGLYINGVYVGKTPGLAFDSPDIERIEVVKGPQGTLYGRNAVAGAINIITKGAELGEFGGNVSFDYGNFDAINGEGSLNIPIGDRFAFKVAGVFSDQDGFIENTGPGADFGGFRRSGINADITWQPLDNLTFKYGYEYNSSTNEPNFSQVIPDTIGPTSFFAPALASPLETGRQDVVNSFVDIQEGETELQGHRISGEWDWAENQTFKALFAYREADSVAFQSFFPEINPAILSGILTTPDPTTGASIIDAFNAIPSLAAGVAGIAPLAGAFGVPFENTLATRPDFNLPFITPFDPPFVPGPFGTFGLTTDGGIPTLDDSETFSIELTQSGSIGSKIDYTAGFFYFDENVSAGIFGDAPGESISLLQLLPGLPSVGELGLALGTLESGLVPPEALPGLIASIDAAAADLSGVLSAARSPGNFLALDTQAFAFFGEVEWRPLDKWTFTFGLRYSNDDKGGEQQGVSPFFNDLIDLEGNAIPLLEGDETFDSIDPKFVIEYAPTDDLLFYTSYAQAFRSGGFNQASVTLDDFVFEEERARSWEVGFKTDIFRDRIRFNGNFFLTFLDDQQFTFTDPTSPLVREVANNDAIFVGFELDGQFVISEYFTASFAYAFLETDAEEFFNPFTGEPIDSADNSPQNSVSVSLDYQRPFFGGDFAGRFGFNHKSATTVLSVPRTNSNLLDARFSYSFDTGLGQRTTLFIYGQNLTDNEFTIDALDAFQPVIADINTFGLARTFGGGISIDF